MDLLPDLNSCLGNADLWKLIPCLCLLEQCAFLLHICPLSILLSQNFFRKLFLINRGYPCSHKVIRCLWQTSLRIQSKRKIFRLHIQFKIEVRVQKCSLPLSCSIWNSNSQKNKRQNDTSPSLVFSSLLQNRRKGKRKDISNCIYWDILYISSALQNTQNNWTKRV